MYSFLVYTRHKICHIQLYVCKAYKSLFKMFIVRQVLSGEFPYRVIPLPSMCILCVCIWVWYTYAVRIFPLRPFFPVLSFRSNDMNKSHEIWITKELTYPNCFDVGLWYVFDVIGLDLKDKWVLCARKTMTFLQ